MGDHDIAGGHIEAHSQATMDKIADFAIPWQRLAVTEAQIARYGLTPIEKTDSRYKGGGNSRRWSARPLARSLSSTSCAPG